jgi:serine protease DegS
MISKKLSTNTILASLIGLCLGLSYLLYQQINESNNQGHSESYASSVNQAAPAVVNIYTQKKITTNESNNQLSQKTANKSVGLGSGVITSSEGYILTNHHVIKGADGIIVALRDGRQTRAKLIGTDPATDLALLKINLMELPSIKMPKHNTTSVGDLVFAIGNPFGIGQTVTMGIISAMGRNQLGLNAYENFIQTDAAINPGNSGGAVINSQGEIIGISTAIYSNSGGSQGIGFAIPIADAVEIMEDLILFGKVERGYLGIEARQITPATVKILNLDINEGLLVSDVTNKSPAQTAGILSGDILLSIDGIATTNANNTRNQIAKYKPGKVVSIVGVRGKQSYQTSIKLGEQPMMGAQKP